MSDPAAPPPDATRYLAEQLRLMRAARGWSLDRAAQATGVSKAMLGQIERGESSPTFTTLWKISDGFECSLTSFLVPAATSAEGAPDTLLRSADALRKRVASDDMLVAPLFPFEARYGFEFLELTLPPGYTRPSGPHAAGVTEHVIVTRGEMEVLVDGHWQHLACGDAIRFDASRPHGYRNPGAVEARCHNLIHYTARSLPHGQTAP